MSENNTENKAAEEESVSQEKLIELMQNKIVFSVYNHLKADSCFLSNLATYYANFQPESISESGELTVNVNDENFAEFCLQYGASDIIRDTLENGLSDGLKKFYDYIGIEIPAGASSTDWDELLQKWNAIRPEINAIKGFSEAQKILDMQTEVETILTDSDNKKNTSYQIHKIQEMFEDVAPELVPEFLAAGYYNLSVLYRNLGKNVLLYSSSKEINEDESACLQKVLDYSADYKRIEYCTNRLKNSKSNMHAIRAAYRRALTTAEKPYDLYKINMALAQTYIDESSAVGFITTDKEEKFNRAEFYLKEAYKNAPEGDKLSMLKKISLLQKQVGHFDDWVETRTHMALKLLENEDRVHVLLDIGQKFSDPNKKRAYFERALNETIRSKKISAEKKRYLVQKAGKELKPYITEEENAAALERLMTKYMPKAQAQTPLDLYKAKSINWEKF